MKLCKCVEWFATYTAFTIIRSTVGFFHSAHMHVSTLLATLKYTTMVCMMRKTIIFTFINFYNFTY